MLRSKGKKITTGQGDDYTTGCLLDYNYSIKHYKMTAIGLSKHQALDFNPKAIRPINLLEIQIVQTVQQCFSLLKKLKKPFQIFHKELLKYEKTHYSTLETKLSKTQLNKLKSEIKNGIEVTLKTSSDVASDSNDQNNFPRKLSLTNTQVSKLRKAFANNLSVNIILSKNQLLKIDQSGGF